MGFFFLLLTCVLFRPTVLIYEHLYPLCIFQLFLKEIIFLSTILLNVVIVITSTVIQVDFNYEEVGFKFNGKIKFIKKLLVIPALIT